jgi:hypothetical protein
MLDSTPRYPSLKAASWRVDVSVSTSSLNRLIEPTVFISLTLSSGHIASFEMSLSAFHLLRFNITLVLKEMEDLLGKQMFKLAD